MGQDVYAISVGRIILDPIVRTDDGRGGTNAGDGGKAL